MAKRTKKKALESKITRKDLVLLILSTVLGTLAGIAVTHWYYLKGEGTTYAIQFMQRAIEDSLFANVYPKYATPQTRTFFDRNPEAPSDRGIPYLDKVIFATPTIKPNQQVDFIFRVSDENWDFGMARHVEVFDSSGHHIPVTNGAFGFMQARFKTALGAGVYQLTFRMTDEAGHRNEQHQIYTVIQK